MSKFNYKFRMHRTIKFYADPHERLEQQRKMCIHRDVDFTTRKLRACAISVVRSVKPLSKVNSL
jgi:hypothetical protein